MTLSAVSIEKPKTNVTFGLSDPKLGIFFSLVKCANFYDLCFVRICTNHPESFPNSLTFNIEKPSNWKNEFYFHLLGKNMYIFQCE